LLSAFVVTLGVIFLRRPYHIQIAPTIMAFVSKIKEVSRNGLATWTAMFSSGYRLESLSSARRLARNFLVSFLDLL
jgi:hypothetical protein